MTSSLWGWVGVCVNEGSTPKMKDTYFFDTMHDTLVLFMIYDNDKMAYYILSDNISTYSMSAIEG